MGIASITFVTHCLLVILMHLFDYPCPAGSSWLLSCSVIRVALREQVCVGGEHGPGSKIASNPPGLDPGLADPKHQWRERSFCGECCINQPRNGWIHCWHFLKLGRGKLVHQFPIPPFLYAPTVQYGKKSKPYTTRGSGVQPVRVAPDLQFNLIKRFS